MNSRYTDSDTHIYTGLQLYFLWHKDGETPFSYKNREISKVVSKVIQQR